MPSPFVKSSLRRYAFAATPWLVVAATPILASTFTWVTPSPVTASWSDASRWGGVAPTGLNASDELIFGGDVGNTGAPTVYTATDDINTGPGLTSGPFLLNRLTLQATGATNDKPNMTIAASNANFLLFSGTAPQIAQNGAGAFVITAPIQATKTLTLTGNGLGQVTFDGPLNGGFDIIKNGTSTFRFGSAGSGSSSPNTWIGALTVNAGTIRFNNNADTAPTALRANPVSLNSATASLTALFKATDPASSLRLGTLSGTDGLIEARGVNATSSTQFDSADIVITTLTDGTYGGMIRNSNTSTVDTGNFIIRGTGNQTLTGNLDIAKDVYVGRGATLTLAGNAKLTLVNGLTQTKGSITLNGGTAVLDNRATNLSDRLRDGDATSTGLDTIGGGTFSLVGNLTQFTSETIGRVQLGSSSNPRSGALTLNVTHNSAGAANTNLTVQSYSRDGSAQAEYTTVNFTAQDSSGAKIALGSAGNGPHIVFLASVPMVNGLLAGTNASSTDIGWATVNGSDFATHDFTLGILPVTTVPFPTGSGSILTNAELTGNGTINAGTGYSLSSLKLNPSAAGQSLTIGTGGSFTTKGIVLGGINDFTISGTGTLKGNATRYIHVDSATLTINSAIDNASTGAIVKSGNGTLALTSNGNSFSNAPLVINAGVVSAPLAAIPFGELRLRGGVVEVVGGGTFARALGTNPGQVSWSGFLNTTLTEVDQDRGSGGFAARGGNLTVDLGGDGASNLTWEDPKFVKSGHAIIFGSATADSRVDFIDNINLTDAGQTGAAVNYNAREIRVNDNANSATDIARLSGKISGTVYNDLLKTGSGMLELTSQNSYLGSTIVQQGTLVVNGSITNSNLTSIRGTSILAGSGTVGGVRIESQGAVAPGDVVGHTSTLTMKDISFSDNTSKFSIEIGGAIAGGNGTNGYDQIKANGGVFLNGAQLEGTLLNGFIPSVTDIFFIIVNDGSDAIQGVFAQNSQVTIGGTAFDVSYNGDSGSNQFSVVGGNDVALRMVPEPTPGLLAMVGGVAMLGLRRRRA